MNPEENHEWKPEPFPEPRTIPEGWNASVISDKGKTQDAPDAENDWQPDPFPEPRSYPWRSGL
jgi:hypothetical protein